MTPLPSASTATFIVPSLSLQMAKYLRGSACVLWDGYCCWSSVTGMDYPTVMRALGAGRDTIRVCKVEIPPQASDTIWQSRAPWCSHYVPATVNLFYTSVYVEMLMQSHLEEVCIGGRRQRCRFSESKMLFTSQKCVQRNRQNSKFNNRGYISGCVFLWNVD